MRPWVDPDLHGWVHKPIDDAEWEELSRRYRGPEKTPLEEDGPERKPLDQIFDVVRAGGCRTVVVENRYVDVDYRSEYSTFWSLKFDGQSPFARRMHFFAADLDEDGLHDLGEAERKSYLGYCVIRPVPYGRIGRTVLRPPPELEDVTLTTIDDRASLFGNPLEVTGVPFCEQDSEFLRCAHAAAWICHYTAARRGLVGRRATAEIVELSPTVLSPERALPSQGMKLNQLQAVFDGMDQPALFYGLSNMPEVPGVDPAPAEPGEAKGEDGEEGEDPEVVHARMVSVICRYLNSGFPVLIGADDHAFVLVGWFRDKTGEARFIACDDQVGPYEIVSSPRDHYKDPWDSIMIPLPPRVFLSGEAAEGNAHKHLHSIFEQTPLLSELSEDLLDGRIVLRTMLREGSFFKRAAAASAASDEVLRNIRFARLPHWVWIVEAHRRELCEAGEPCVVATAVFDSTSFDIEPPVDVLMIPGRVVVYPPDGAERVVADSGTEPWESMLAVH